MTTQNDWQAAYALFPGRIAYAWMSQPCSSGRPLSGLDACGFIRRSLIIWDKGHIVHRAAVTTTGDTRRAGTPSRRARKPTGMAGDRKASTIWEIKTNPESLKPATRPRSRSSVCSELSTTTRATSTTHSSGLAPHSLPVSKRGAASTRIEIEPAYVDVTVKRWEEFTGQKAQRQK